MSKLLLFAALAATGMCLASPGNATFTNPIVNSTGADPYA